MTDAALPKGYHPTEEEEYMNPMQLAFFRKKLLEWRAELQRETAATYEKFMAGREKDSESTDQGKHEEETAFEIRTRDRYRKLMKKIDGALARIDEGSYGYCEETGEPIGIRRLEARPVATLCIEAQERHERDERFGIA